MSMTCPHAFKGEENTFSALHNCKCNVPSSARACPEFRLSMLVKRLDTYDRKALVTHLWELNSPLTESPEGVVCLHSFSQILLHVP